MRDEMKRYHFVTRPDAPVHGHPVLVFDCLNQLHVPLTVFAKEARVRVADGTARTYLNAILPFFTFLEVNEWQFKAGKRWDSEPTVVRQAVDDYLVGQLRCKVQSHREGFQLVMITAGTRSSVRVFLSGLKLFYRVVQEAGYYPYSNPLVDSVAATTELLRQLEADTETPRMPVESGVTAPRRKQRLSDSYFKLQGEEWIPQVVDDPTLPARLLAAGRQVGWSLRDEVVTRMLFETGGRISEVTGLTLGDWAERGLLQEASAFSKGSHGVRVKFLRFSPETAKLLRRYFDGERHRHDPDGFGLDSYIRSSRSGHVNLREIPLFLTARRTGYGPEAFRVHWNEACALAGLDVDCHQARHWYTTMAVRQIYEQAQVEGEVKRRLRELIEYMKWRSGEAILDAYRHYFDAARHAEIQDVLYRRLDAALKHEVVARATRARLQPVRQIPVQLPDDPDFEFLRSLGDSRDAD
jgi:integrase